MRQTSSVLILILGILVSAYGQSLPPQQGYLTTSLDLNRTILGQNFMGHDIIAVFEAIKRAPALQTKSEFETTSEYEARRSKFVDTPLYANIMPTGYFAFVPKPSGNPMYSSYFEFTYDADSQTLAVKLTGDIDYHTGNGTTLDRFITREKTRILGLTPPYRPIIREFWGLVFNQDGWLFRSSPSASDRKFTYSLATTMEEARALKADGHVLLVCRLIQPWFRTHNETSSGSSTEYKYLQVIPEQLWIFNKRTGEVVRKISESSIVSEHRLRTAPSR